MVVMTKQQQRQQQPPLQYDDDDTSKEDEGDEVCFHFDADSRFKTRHQICYCDPRLATVSTTDFGPAVWMLIKPA
jgi:hypothetical protein